MTTTTPSMPGAFDAEALQRMRARIDDVQAAHADHRITMTEGAVRLLDALEHLPLQDIQELLDDVDPQVSAAFESLVSRLASADSDISMAELGQIFSSFQAGEDELVAELQARLQQPGADAGAASPLDGLKAGSLDWLLAMMTLLIETEKERRQGQVQVEAQLIQGIIQTSNDLAQKEVAKGAQVKDQLLSSAATEMTGSMLSGGLAVGGAVKMKAADTHSGAAELQREGARVRVRQAEEVRGLAAPADNPALPAHQQDQWRADVLQERQQSIEGHEVEARDAFGRAGQADARAAEARKYGNLFSQTSHSARTVGESGANLARADSTDDIADQDKDMRLMEGSKAVLDQRSSAADRDRSDAEQGKDDIVKMIDAMASSQREAMGSAGRAGV